MIRLPTGAPFAVIVASGLLAATQALAAPVVVDYAVAATGQSVRASFDFLDASRLQISLFETTPAGASALTGGGAILTNLGFLLPRVQIAGGSVVIGPGGTTAGFPGGELANAAAAQTQLAAQQDEIATSKAALAKAKRDAAAQLLANNPDAQMRADAADLIKSAEQDEAIAGAARTARDGAIAEASALQTQADEFAARALVAPVLQLVGVLQRPLTPFLASAARHTFDGLDGGLIGNPLARGGEAVIVNSVLLSLTLSDALVEAEQQEFLAGLSTGSSIGYGAGGLLSGQPPVAVSEPSMTSLAIATLLALGLMIGRRRRSPGSAPSRAG